MDPNLLAKLARGGYRGRFRSPIGVPRVVPPSRPALESLAARALPSFAAPVSYKIGTQAKASWKGTRTFFLSKERIVARVSTRSYSAHWHLSPWAGSRRTGIANHLPSRLYLELLEERLAPTSTPPNFVITDTTPLPIIPPSLQWQRQCDGSLPNYSGDVCFADGLVPSYYRSDGALTVFNSEGPVGRWLRTGPDLASLVDVSTPFQRVTVDLSTRPPDQYPIHQIGNDRPAVWLEGVWSDSKGTLYSVYHDENYQPCYSESNPDSRPSYRTGMAKSLDGGLNWTDLGIVLGAVDGIGPRCDSQSTDTVGGAGDVSLFVDTGNQPNYVYIFFSGYDGLLAQGYQGVGVARMPLSDIDHPVGQFQKWYQGQWAPASAGPAGPFTPIFPALREMHPTDPRPPLPAPCVPTSDFVWGPQVYYDDNAGQYVMMLNRISDPTGVCTARDWSYGGWNEAEIRVSFSADLSDPTSWTTCTPHTPDTADACDADSRLNYRPFYVGNGPDLGRTPDSFLYYAEVIGLQYGDTSQHIADTDRKNQPRLFDSFFVDSHLFHILRDDEPEPSGDGVVVRHTHDLSRPFSLPIDAPETVVAGVPFDFTVDARDAYGNLASGYIGTVRFLSSDPGAVLPEDYTFTLADAGSHSFAAILITPGIQSLSVFDVKAPDLLMGEQDGIEVTAPDHASPDGGLGVGIALRLLAEGVVAGALVPERAFPAAPPTFHHSRELGGFGRFDVGMSETPGRDDMVALWAMFTAATPADSLAGSSLERAWLDLTRCGLFRIWDDHHTEIGCL